MDDALKVARQRVRVAITAEWEPRYAAQACAYRLARSLTRCGYEVSVTLNGGNRGDHAPETQGAEGGVGATRRGQKVHRVHFFGQAGNCFREAIGERWAALGAPSNPLTFSVKILDGLGAEKAL
jgi:hypothetical protein